MRNYEGSYVNDNSIGIKVDALKGRKTMLDEVPAPDAEAPNENEETIKMLDELRNQAMGAYDSMPDGTPDIMKAMVKADYEKVMAYLEEVRNQAIGQSNGEPAPAAAKASATSLAAVRVPDPVHVRARERERLCRMSVRERCVLAFVHHNVRYTRMLL